MVNDLIRTTHSDGTMPLQTLTEFSAKRRITAYLSLAEQWSNATATGSAVLENSDTPEANMFEEGGEYIRMKVKDKILFNVKSIIEDHARMKNEVATKKYNAREEEEEEKRQETGVKTIISSLVSRKNKRNMEPNARVKIPSTKKQKTNKKTLPCHIAFDALEDASTISDISFPQETERSMLLMLFLVVYMNANLSIWSADDSMERLEQEMKRHEDNYDVYDIKYLTHSSYREQNYRMKRSQIQQESIEMMRETVQHMKWIVQKLNEE